MVNMKTAQQWINTIKCPITRKKLRTAYEGYGLSKKLKYINMLHFIRGGFFWAGTIEGFHFWDGIYNHFEKGSGRKSYKDFKHLDQSINNGRNRK